MLLSMNTYYVLQEWLEDLEKLFAQKKPDQKKMMLLFKEIQKEFSDHQLESQDLYGNSPSLSDQVPLGPFRRKFIGVNFIYQLLLKSAI